jgi:hypothetical protein
MNRAYLFRPIKALRERDYRHRPTSEIWLPTMITINCHVVAEDSPN